MPNQHYAAMYQAINNAYAQRQRADLANESEHAKLQDYFKVAQSPEMQGLVNEGGGYSVGSHGVSVQKDPYAMQAGKITGEGQKLDSAAQKSMGNLGGQLQQLSTMHKLLDNPSSIDAKQLGAGFARITEGQGQRLLQSLVQSMGAPNDVVSDTTKSMNFLTAAASSPIGSATHNAMRENLFKHQDALNSQLDDEQSKFMQRGSLLAPHLDASKYQQAASAAMPSQLLRQELEQRKAKYYQERNAKAPSGMGAQSMQPQSMMDKLTGFFRPQQQQAPAPQTPQQVQPDHAAAAAWAKANPKDPRAQQIMQSLQQQGQ